MTTPLKKPEQRPASKQRLRFWLRLLKLQRHMEAVIREKLRAEFGTTLPRFDVMAALHQHERGLRMSALSSVLKVSNGNVTGIVDRLVLDGYVVRVPVKGDRRAMVVRLTQKGRDDFIHMASVHEGWVSDLLGELSPDEAEAMMAGMDRLNQSLGEQT
ncbi:MAG: MarR family transcriptional regulator [Pseudomonadota bacterium]